MLVRVLEPEVMDSPQEAADYDAMDHSAVNRLFVDDFLAVWRAKGLKGEILDLGTGTAQIPIELLRSCPELSVTAIDLAESMLELARRNVAQAGLSQQIRLERTDAKGLTYPSHHFAAVISNSIVHHIPEPSDVLDEACRVLRPGGALFVRDLLRPDTEEQVGHLVSTYAAGANRHQRDLFEASLRAALSLAEIRGIVARLEHDASRVRQTSDRHWTWSM
ncbi:MAG TPA: methyltransferase domain-containing protein [Pirellulales bacterium]|nr:methyltransferase domain-containing protein [Pirellulales bacterium]